MTTPKSEKKIVAFILVTLFLILAGGYIALSPPWTGSPFYKKETFSSVVNMEPKPAAAMSTIYYSGHSYIVYGTREGGSILHNPECFCQYRK